MKKKVATVAMGLLLVLQAAACGSAGESFAPDGELTSAGSKARSVQMLTSVDDFGRAMPPSGGDRTDRSRYVGLFYFLWSGQYHSDRVRDIDRMLYEGDESLWEPVDTQAFHHWGEPLFGYYNSRDPWVIRKHVELLTLAGVDFLVFDTTNNTLYYDVLDVLLPILQEYADAGWKVPKFVFYTNSNSANVIRALYYGGRGYGLADSSSASPLCDSGIYRAGKYRDLWFAPEGKPMIVGLTENNGGASDQPASFALDSTADAEILDFFDIKESQWPTSAYRNPEGFPWMEFTADPHAYGDTVNVSVAQHNRLPFSDALLSSVIAGQMMGRGWHDGRADHSEQAVFSGANFEERYEKARALDPAYLFVTGWNEWVAQKQYGTGNSPNAGLDPTLPKQRVFFVDTVNTEYSRDVEMMKGGYFDNFYLQMARNNRAYKGTPYDPVPAPAVSIDIKKGLSQWNAVADIYCDFVGDAPARDFVGHAVNLTYTAPAAVNDIREVRVAADAEALYFLVETQEDIVPDPRTGELPKVYLSVPGRAGGFAGYHYEVTPAKGGVTVSALSGEDKLIRTPAGKGAYTRGGRYLQIRVPRSALQLTGALAVHFKVVDGADLTRPESFYTEGDACPIGRMNFAFYGC